MTLSLTLVARLLCRTVCLKLSIASVLPKNSNLVQELCVWSTTVALLKVFLLDELEKNTMR